MFPSLKELIIYLMRQELMFMKTLELIQDSVELTVELFSKCWEGWEDKESKMAQWLGASS